MAASKCRIPRELIEEALLLFLDSDTKAADGLDGPAPLAASTGSRRTVGRASRHGPGYGEPKVRWNDASRRNLREILFRKPRPAYVAIAAETGCTSSALQTAPASRRSGPACERPRLDSITELTQDQASKLISIIGPPPPPQSTRATSAICRSAS